MNTYNLKQNKLRDIRIEKGLTQRQVADILGKKCEDRISHWENGEAMQVLRTYLDCMRCMEFRKRRYVI